MRETKEGERKERRERNRRRKKVIEATLKLHYTHASL
jgi:hypothetical protein